MIEIILKIIVGSGILLGLYHLLLVHEKTFKFNRFFLIFALIFAYAIPFIPVKLPIIGKPTQKLVMGTIEITALHKQNSTATESFPISQVLLFFFFTISIFLLLRLIFSISKILKLKGNRIKYQGLNLFLAEKDLSPFTFFNTIYLSKTKFNTKKIDTRILEHEWCHIQERHVLDLVLIEILIVFSWINPFLYGYKRAILSNHEFLADQKVIRNTSNIPSYQHLILDEIENNQQYKLIHPFNFNNIKKRFIMMTTSKSKFAIAKNLLTLPFFAALFLGFSQTAEAQTTPTSPMRKSKTQVVKAKQLQKTNNAITTSRTTTPSDSEVAPPPPPPAVDRLAAKAAKSAATDEVTPPAQEIPAEFPGGVNVFRNKFGAAFDTSKINPAKGLMKAMVHFTITQEGKTENFRAEGDNALFNELAIEAAKKSTADITWKPATLNGTAVQSEFKLPITMYFE